MHEEVIDDREVNTKVSWAAYRDCPVSFAFVLCRNYRGRPMPDQPRFDG